MTVDGRRKKSGRGGKQRQRQRRSKKERDDAESHANTSEVRYKPTHRILIVGDGDFSFSRGLVRHIGGDGRAVIATSYDSLSTVDKKYKGSNGIIKELEGLGATVVNEIDARTLHDHFPRQKDFFHRVIFNFPHTGMQRVHLNKDLVRQFLVSAPYVLHPNGQIHITIKDGPPYTGWNIPEEASQIGLVHAGTLDFNQTLFPGYRHQTTLHDAKKFNPMAEGPQTKSKTLVFMKPSTFILQVEPSSEQFKKVRELKGARKDKRKKNREKLKKKREAQKEKGQEAVEKTDPQATETAQPSSQESAQEVQASEPAKKNTKKKGKRALLREQLAEAVKEPPAKPPTQPQEAASKAKPRGKRSKKDAPDAAPAPGAAAGHNRNHNHAHAHNRNQSRKTASNPHKRAKAAPPSSSPASSSFSHSSETPAQPKAKIAAMKTAQKLLDKTKRAKKQRRALKHSKGTNNKQTAS